MAALTSLLHFIPLGGAITLLALHWTRYWIGQAPSGLVALQFIAKFHEILMQASLVDILVYFIRAQALEGYIPLGALSGAAQASQLSYLWSLDFVSAIWSPTFRMWRRVTFGLVVSAMLLMITAVGPSAAVLMIPRPDMETTSATEMRYLNISNLSLYPVAFDDLNILNISNYGSSDKFVKFEETESLELNAWTDTYMIDMQRTMYGMESPRFMNESNTRTAVTTAPTLLAREILILRESCGSCDRLSSSPTRHVRALVMRSPQPFVVTTCTDFPVLGDEDIYLTDDKSKKLLVQPRLLYERLMSINRTHSANATERPVLWTPAADDPYTLVSLNLESPQVMRSDPKPYVVCTVSAFWRTARTVLEDDNGITRAKAEMPNHLRNIPKKDLTPIKLGVNLLESTTKDLKWSGSRDFVQEMAEYVAHALADVPYDLFNAAFDKDTSSDDQSKAMRGFLPTGIRDISKSTPYRIETVKQGYGYGTRDRAAQLSVAVITAYCLITLLYIGYITITGHASLGWTSPTELIMLALQSKEPSNIGHVSVGIDSMETLRRNVGIRVSTVDIGDTGEIKERLELVYDDDEEAERRDLTKVVRGRAYSCMITPDPGHNVQ